MRAEVEIDGYERHLFGYQACTFLIKVQNWQKQYKQFMPYGMQAMFEGKCPLHVFGGGVGVFDAAALGGPLYEKYVNPLMCGSPIGPSRIMQ